MARWTEIIQRIEQKYPFLSTLQFTADTEVIPDFLPDLLKISIASASGMVAALQSRVAVIFPHMGTTPAWIAVGTALVGMREDFRVAASDTPAGNLPPLKPNSLVKIDGKHVAFFEQETERGFRVKLHSGTIPNRGFLEARIIIPRADRLRLQPTATNRQLAHLANVVRPQKEFLDHLLGIETFGNRSIFRTHVILVTGVGSISSLLHHTQIDTDTLVLDTPQSFAGLLQWGIIRTDGKLADRSVGQITASPVLLFAPDLIAVRAFLRENPNIKPLIVLDGGDTILRREGVLDDVLDTGCPALACLETHETERIDALVGNAFKMWVWSRKDLHTLLDEEGKRRSSRIGSYFTPFLHSCYNYARHNVCIHICEDRTLQEVAEGLEEAVRQLRRAGTDGQESIELESLMYGCLLGPARMVRPLCESKIQMDRQIARLKDELSRRRWCMPEAVRASATRLADTVHDLTASLLPDHNAKVEALRELLLQSRFQSIGILVSNAGELEVTRQYWKPFILKHSLHVHFFVLNTAHEPTVCDHLIICGWLNKQKMRRLLDGSLASRITTLLYPFEQKWSLRATRQWLGASINGMSDSEKTSLLALGPTVVIKSEPDVQPSEESPEQVGAPDALDVSDFEVRLQQYQCDALVRSAQSSQEEMIRAVYVRFTAGYYAFLTDKHTLPVATDMLAENMEKKQEIPRKKLPELREGDYVVFREGAQGDVLREWADRGLKKAGKGNLRAVATLWKDALRSFMWIDLEKQVMFLNAERFSYMVHRLHQAGIQTSEGTIRWWLLGESTIGPAHGHDLEAIATATGSTELHTRLAEVREAIKQVRGAHLQAANRLAERLFSTLPKRLAEVTIESSPRIDLGEDGSVVVVRIEEIAEKPVEVGWSQVNCLLEDTNLQRLLPTGVL